MLSKSCLVVSSLGEKGKSNAPLRLSNLGCHLQC